MWAVQRSVESHLISLLLDPSRTSVRPQGWEVYMSCERHFPVDSLGYAYSGLSGRVSHTLSLRGPCFTVDTACSATAAASQNKRWLSSEATFAPFPGGGAGLRQPSTATGTLSAARESKPTTRLCSRHERGRSAAASGVNLQLSAAIWAQLPSRDSRCREMSQPERSASPRCGASLRMATARPSTPLPMALRAERAWAAGLVESGERR